MSGAPPKHLVRYASKWLSEELKNNAKLGNWEAAIATLQQIRESSLVELNVFHYSSAIAACSSAGQLTPALGLFHEMTHKGIAPNVYTYTSLVTACGKTGEVDMALKLFADMRLAKVPPNVHTVTALITTCARAGAWERGIKILHSSVSTLSVPPNVRTYTAAIEGCRRAGVCSPAMALLHEMNNRCDVLPNEVTYHTALGCCCTGDSVKTNAEEDNRVEFAQRIFARMVASGYYPIPYTKTLLENILKGTPWEGMEVHMPVSIKRDKKRTDGRPDVDPATAHNLEKMEASGEDLE